MGGKLAFVRGLRAEQGLERGVVLAGRVVLGDLQGRCASSINAGGSNLRPNNVGFTLITLAKGYK